MVWRPLSLKLVRKNRLIHRYFIIFVMTTSVLMFTWNNKGPTNSARVHNDASNGQEFQKHKQTKTERRPMKRIFIWNSPHRIEVAAFGQGHDAFIDAKCKVTDCEIFHNSTQFWSTIVRSNYRLLSVFDAILVNVHDLSYSFLPPIEIGNYKRPQSQRIVFLTQESPATMEKVKIEEMDGLFNWTMTYRLNSDVQLLYGRTIKRSVPLMPSPSPSTIGKEKKKKKVAWMASHCPTSSKREEYVRQLQQFVQVDVYGKCGNGTFNCPRNEMHWISDPQCYVQLAADYKFYLSFENSICTDYVTEKFFDILQHEMVPIVLGGADYSRIAPPHSFIDARQFEAKQLADYINKLDADDALYSEYFQWKINYEIESGSAQMSRHGFCDLCAKLHDNDNESAVKYYQSLVPEWRVDNQCTNHST